MKIGQPKLSERKSQRSELVVAPCVVIARDLEFDDYRVEVKKKTGRLQALPLVFNISCGFVFNVHRFLL